MSLGEKSILTITRYVPSDTNTCIFTCLPSSIFNLQSFARESYTDAYDAFLSSLTSTSSALPLCFAIKHQTFLIKFDIVTMLTEPGEQKPSLLSSTLEVRGSRFEVLDATVHWQCTRCRWDVAQHKLPTYLPT